MKKKRTALGKKVRFEVFKRDDFQCQYCGAKAPNVTLHVDHIKPVSRGGTNEIMNLVASCHACNMGKTNRELRDANIIELKKRIKGIQKSTPSPEYLAWFDEKMWNEPAVGVDNPLYFLGWWWLIKEAAREDYRKNIKGKTVVIRRGQVPRSIRHTANELGCTIGKAGRFLARLENEKMIEIDNGVGISIITLCNYDELQIDGMQAERVC